MGAKPFSIQHRVILIQAGVFALALWFLAGTLYVNLRIDHELKESIRSLESELRIHTEIASTLASLRELIRSKGNPSRPDAVVASNSLATLTGLIRQYGQLGAHAPDLRWRAAMELAGIRLTDETRAILSHRDSSLTEELRVHLKRLDELSGKMEMLVNSRTNQQLNELSLAHGRLEDYTLTLTLLFVAIGLLGTLALLQARRIEAREIWAPLEDLRRMVVEMRGGNLAITADVPHNLEFGTLVRGFLEMARGLREGREFLEQKVKERTASLETAQRELIQAAKLSSLGLLVSGVAHEINNPLTSILGFSELALSRAGLEPRLRNALETIREEALRLKGLVSNLSSFARRGAQRTERLDIRLVLDRVIQLRRYQLHAVNIELRYARPKDPVWIEGDADQLVQVVFNLVLNAEQAIEGFREKGGIWIGCGKSGGRRVGPLSPEAWVSVRDDGIGIPPAHLDSIFDPFFTTKPVGKGTGLGLSISHGIIQGHRGTIRVESVEGRGTTMRIFLPAEGPFAGTPGTPRSMPAGGDLGPAKGVAERAAAQPDRNALVRRALIIDDEPAIVEFVKQGLEARGWETETRPSADDLELLLQDAEFDVVLCDLKMPGRNGIEVLRLLRARAPRLSSRFLLMTGNLADADRVMDSELAGVPILWKPFTLRQLGEAVGHIQQ